MYMSTHRVRRRILFFSLSLAVVLVLAFSACGTNTSTNTGNPPSTGGPTPTATQSQANANGCPNNAVVTTPAPANITLTTNDSRKTVEVKKGDTVEVDLSFGHLWQGPTNLSQDLLAMQSPAGYASAPAKACVWRFVATGTGVAHLSFDGRPICKKGQLCPMYILAVPFTLDIK